MANFGSRSLRQLRTADYRLQWLFHKVIQRYDCSVLEGYRSDSKQRAMYMRQVSKLDGVTAKSNHQSVPSRAVDVTPWPIDWQDIEAFEALAVIVKEEAVKAGIDVGWGGDWNSFKDYPHWELT